MKLSKIFSLSLNMLFHSKLRSWLTIIGILIGVGAVVAIISLGQGLSQSVNSQIQGLGQDIITISGGSARAFGPGGGDGGRSSINQKQLTDSDVAALRLVPGVKSIDSIVSGRATIKFQSESTTSSIQGHELSVFSDFITATLESGRFLVPGDSNAVLIGNSIAHSTFTTPLEVGSVIIINDQTFRVVGILNPVSGFGGSDNAIYMSTKDARNVLGSTITLKSNEYSSIQVKVNDVNFITDVSNVVETALDNSHHVLKNKEDFSISTAQAIQARFSAVTGGITIFLGIIAAVSLLVGGIGVANTMFTNVLEKTRDIGVMKAIGAKNSDILMIFLMNSGMLGFVGGALGIGLFLIIALGLPFTGIGISMGFGRGGGGLSIPVNPELMIFAVLFAIGIGMISGLIPAYRASKLKPVEALRYE